MTRATVPSDLATVIRTLLIQKPLWNKLFLFPLEIPLRFEVKYEINSMFWETEYFTSTNRTFVVSTSAIQIEATLTSKPLYM